MLIADYQLLSRTITRRTLYDHYAPENSLELTPTDKAIVSSLAGIFPEHSYVPMGRPFCLRFVHGCRQYLARLVQDPRMPCRRVTEIRSRFEIGS